MHASTRWPSPAGWSASTPLTRISIPALSRKRFEEALFMCQSLSDVSCRFVAADRRVLLWPAGPLESVWSRCLGLALRPYGLGKSARCRETSDVVYVHRDLLFRTVSMRQNSVHPCAEVFEPIQTPFERPSIRVSRQRCTRSRSL
jgi:hypothetical protein